MVLAVEWEDGIKGDLEGEMNLAQRVISSKTLSVMQTSQVYFVRSSRLPRRLRFQTDQPTIWSRILEGGFSCVSFDVRGPV